MFAWFIRERVTLSTKLWQKNFNVSSPGPHPDRKNLSGAEKKIGIPAMALGGGGQSVRAVKNMM